MARGKITKLLTIAPQSLGQFSPGTDFIFSRRNEYLEFGGNIWFPAVDQSIPFTLNGSWQESVSRLSPMIGDRFSIAAHGAVPGVNCLNVLLFLAQAFPTGTIVVPSGDYVVTVTADKVLEFNLLVPRLVIEGSLSVTFPAGQFSLTFPTYVDKIHSGKFELLGAPVVSVSILSQVGVSGVAGNYNVTLQLNTAAGLTVGDVLHTWQVVGTGCPEIHRGGWEILSISGSNVVVKNTCRYATFPVNTITSSNSAVLKTVFNYQNCDGLVCPRSSVYTDRIAYMGNSDSYWSSSNVTGTEKGTHGCYVGSMTIALNGKVDNVNARGLTNGCVSSGTYTAFCGFDQQGVCVELGGRFWGDFVSSCNNKRRGWYSSTSAGIRAKHITGNGNFLDGAITDIGGDIYTSSQSAFIGNGGAGASAAHGGSVICDTMISAYNLRGSYATANGVIQATSMLVSFCTDGILLEYGGSALIDNAYISNCSAGVNALRGTARANSLTLTDNVTHLRATEQAFINAGGSTTFNGTGTNWVTRAGGLILLPTGYVGSELNATRIISRTGQDQRGAQFSAVSDGSDMVLSMDLTGSGTFSSMLHLRNTGIYSHVTETMSVGRPSELMTTVYAKTGTINTSDGRLKTEVRPFTADELSAAKELASKIGVFQWLSSIQEKGAAARQHIGMHVQTAMEVMVKYRLNPYEFGFICYDSWGDEFDDEGVQIRKAGDLYSFRMDQLNLFIVRGLDQRLSALEALTA